MYHPSKYISEIITLATWRQDVYRGYTNWQRRQTLAVCKWWKLQRPYWHSTGFIVDHVNHCWCPLWCLTMRNVYDLCWPKMAAKRLWIAPSHDVVHASKEQSAMTKLLPSCLKVFSYQPQQLVTAVLVLLYFSSLVIIIDCDHAFWMQVIYTI
jgi:hypothetical protein